MHKKSLRTFLIAGAFALIGGFIGIGIGVLLYGTILPFWSAKPIAQTSGEAVDILFVDYQYAEAVDLDGNILYVETQSGEVYSVSQNNSGLLSPLPNENAVSQIRLRSWEADAPIVAIADQGLVYQMVDNQWETIEGDVEQFKGFTPRLCADEWHLPVTGVIDSAGTVFSHALADEYVCYVLYADGQLQVWTRTRDAFSLMGSLVMSGLVGLIVGFNAIPIANYFRRVKGHGRDSSGPKAAQHSPLRYASGTAVLGDGVRVFKQFAWLEVGSVKVALSRPAPRANTGAMVVVDWRSRVETHQCPEGAYPARDPAARGRRTPSRALRGP